MRERVRVQKSFVRPSLTKQADSKACDINNIMRRYEKDGVITHVNRYQGEYGNFLGVPEYHDAVNQVLAAENMFLSLPAKVRSRFNNDPAAFIDFAQTEGNRDELVALGLIPPKPPEPVKEVLDVRVVSPEPPKSS